jgi:RHS repeat-associated protein
MPTILILPNEQLTPRAHAPAGGPNLIASFKNDIIGQSATSFATSTKVMHGEVASADARVTTLYHGNQQYSVTALSDSSGNVSERYAYTAYGQPTFLNASGAVQTSSAAGNRYTYTGREWDSTLGLHHFRARWMSGLTGRFLTRDPIGFNDGWSLYGIYIGLSKSDPNGEKITSCIFCAACAVALETACGIPCAIDGYWDVPGEGVAVCIGKCNLAIGEICSHGSGMVACLVCGSGCLDCLLMKVLDHPPPPPKPPIRVNPDTCNPYAPPLI